MAQGRATRLVYASGNYGKAILFGTLEFALLYVMTDLLGLPPATAGALILVTLLVDAVLDGFVGFAADRLRPEMKGYWPFILVGAPLASASFLAFAALPLQQRPDIILVAVTLLAFRLGYAVMDIPHNALIGAVAPSSRERASLAGVRSVFSSAASLTLAVTVGPLGRSEPAGEAITPERLFAFAVFAAVTSLITMLAAGAATRKADRAAARLAPEPSAFATSVRVLLAAKSFRIALASSFLTSLLLPLHLKSHLYLSKYVLGEPTFAGVLLGAMICAQLASTPFWLFAMQRLEKARAMQLAHGVCAVGMLIGWAFVEVDRLGVLAGTIVFGAGFFGVLSLIWSMIADCVDEARSTTGVQVEGMMFAVAIMSQKIAFGLAIAAYGLALSLVGFEAHAAIDARSALVFTAFGFALPALGSIASILLMRGYTLTHAAHARMQA